MTRIQDNVVAITVWCIVQMVRMLDHHWLWKHWENIRI